MIVVDNYLVWNGGLTLAFFWIVKQVLDKVLAFKRVQRSVAVEIENGSDISEAADGQRPVMYHHIVAGNLPIIHSLRFMSYPASGALLWLDPFHSIALVLGPYFPRAGTIGYYGGKFSLYNKYGATCLSSVRIWNAQPYFWLADADAIKVITSDRHTFRKDVAAYEPLNIYGENLVGAEGADWKRHRAVAMPAFSEANNALVWSETIRVISEWFAELDTKQEQLREAGDATPFISIDVTAVMVQATLLVISAAGFGRRTSWVDDNSTEPPPGHSLTFRSAVGTSVDNVILRILLPSWVSALPIPHLSSRLRNTYAAFEELRLHMLELVSQARAAVYDGKPSASDAALLTNLVQANLAQEGDVKRLSDEELLSNIFTFLLAGHETSAHSLGFAVALLALYPEVQRKVYEEAANVWPSGVPTGSTSSYKDDFPKLEYSMAVFRETLRHFPAEPRLVKPVHVDATLPARRFSPHSYGRDDQHNFIVAVPAGSCVVMDIYAIHMNPIHWGEDVQKFRPERFIDTDSYRWPRDAFLAFSAGARSCIGQRFSLTESICILASLVRRYEVLVPQDLRSKPFEEQKRVMLQWTTGVTLTPTNSRVQLRRRA